MRARLPQPLRSLYDIERRLDLVQAFVDDALLRAQLHTALLARGVPDVERLGRRFGAGKASLAELWRAYQFTERLPELIRALDEYAAGGAAGAALIVVCYCGPLRAAAADFGKLQQLVRASIELDAAAQGEYLIQPRYDPELAELFAEREAAMLALHAHVADVAADLGFKGKDADKVKLVAHAGTGLQLLRVTRKDEPALRNRSAYTVLGTKKDGVTFAAPGTRALATRWDAAAKGYREKQAALVSKVLQVAGTFAPVMLSCAATLADLDVSAALAVAAVSAPVPYVRPTMVAASEPRRIVLRGCRHPCMEALSTAGGFIPNDVALEHGISHFQIVTGPNMGGKSTYIRAAGISVLLAHAGCFVPCDEATISLTDAILARVGAGDCQARGLSTFMAEMLETATIIRCASKHSLVLIDELGRGTSTYDGYGLAWAISEHLATRVRCSALFATHFHELTELQQLHPHGVTNRHVSAHVQDGKMAMLFQVRDGPCDQSFGIHVAELARFPAEVVAAAKRKAAELEDFGDGGGDGRHVRACAPADAADAGEAAVHAFLAEFAKLPLEGAAPDAAAGPVRELLAKLKAEHGSEAYVAGILA
uniref:DNA mismatch repair proteins mutS family domain-containing protein n=1 Tax=Diacronema lutheri TaxID=2081491 RepID=A0A7R9UQW4_DIALT